MEKKKPFPGEKPLEHLDIMAWL